MSNDNINVKMKKETFEKMLYAKNLNQPLDHCVHKKTHLYYNDSGHVGSWEQGNGWIFKNKVLEDGNLLQTTEQ